MNLRQAIRKVPGFRSGSKIKATIASVFYLFVLFFILLIVLPSSESSTPPLEQQPSPGPSLGSTTETPPEVKGEQTQEVLVVRVIDGDTIEIEGGQKVRYIGIDTPESVDPNEPVGCYAKEASNKNKELVLNKKVRLEKDVSETDKYGRLLRYIWVGDLMVNEYLVREGYAQSSTYPPDVKYQDRFIEAQRKAREEEKGLWSSYCDTWGQSTPTPTPIVKISRPTPTPTSTVKITQPTPTKTTKIAQPTPTPILGGGTSYTCNCSKTCSQMSSCEEAYYQLNTCGCSVRDGDKDGVPCEDICLGG